MTIIARNVVIMILNFLVTPWCVGVNFGGELLLEKTRDYFMILIACYFFLVAYIWILNMIVRLLRAKCLKITQSCIWCEWPGIYEYMYMRGILWIMHLERLFDSESNFLSPLCLSIKFSSDSIDLLMPKRKLQRLSYNNLFYCTRYYKNVGDLHW